MSLPPFTPEGLLPVGDHPLTLGDLRTSHLVTGRHVGSKTWSRAWRFLLTARLAVLVDQLWKVGITEIYIDGSLVERKDHPNDIDGYFECGLRYYATRQLERDLNAQDPFKVWTWDPASRRPHPDSIKRELPMWHRYRVELYPYWPGALCGIRDLSGKELSFPEAFRLTRNTCQPKGIVKIIK